jgi:4-hydroxybenzoate polyprenyltransferase
VAFCATASGIYILNDLLDLETDRKHHRKRRRPFASGALSLRHGWIGPALVALGVLLAWQVSAPAAGMISLYVVVTTAYSAWIKTQPLVDIFTLAGLYMLRIIAGGVATEIRVSVWLLGFSSFLFLALACVKRVAELDDATADPRSKLTRRGYMPADIATLRSMGIASTFASSLVLSLYVDTTLAGQLYAAPQVLWLVVPLLLLVQCRLWLSTGRGQMHDDPLVFAAKDRVSWLIVALVAVVFLIASHGLP